MNKKWKLVGVLCFLLSIPALMFVYPYLNTPTRGVHTLFTSLNKWMNWIIVCFSTSIIIATLFIKQHVLLDVIASIVLVEWLFKMVELLQGWLFIPKRNVKPIAKKSFSV